MLGVKKSKWIKYFLAFCIFFSFQVQANTLPFNWTELNSSNPPPAREFASQAFDPCSGKTVIFGGSSNGITLDDTWVFDAASNAWTELSPVNSPSTREAAVMIFDQSTGYLILFGGVNNGVSLGDTWSFDLMSFNWTELSPSSAPSPRYASTMDYDASSGQLILFGGYNGSTYFNDTWAFDPVNNTWINLNPANPPSLRLGAAMSFNPCNGQNFLFGGKGPNGLLNDSWVFNANDNVNTWTPLNPPVSPEARYSASMDFDQTNGLMVLFGGKGNNGLLNDTWGFDARDNVNTWAQLTQPNSPPARYRTRMKFNPSSGQMILFGGSGNSGDLNDTWAYGIPSNAVLFWTNLNPTASPQARFSACFAFDQTSGQMILFGGITHAGGTYLNDTWGYDIERNIWTELFPSNPPSPRNSARMDFDPSNGKIILFGGNGPGGILADTWSFDSSLNSWTNVTPNPSPAARNAPSMGFDQCSGRLILFVGFGAGNQDLDDTWAYDARGNTWTQLTTIGTPPARDSASMAFDSSSGQLILFGGYSNNTGGNLLNDTWGLTFSHITNTYTWMDLSPANPPSGRYGVAMKFDPASGQVILFGGGYLSGTDNDTWAYDGKANTWMELNPINPPGAREFPAFVFNPNSGQMILFGGVNLPTQTVYDDTQALGFGVPPQITSANTVTFEVGVFSSFTVTTSGFPNPTITEVGTLPTGVTFFDNGDGTATLSGTPTVLGTYSFTITAGNQLLPNATQIFMLQVGMVLPPSNFTGVIKKNKFLNKTEYFLTATFNPSPSPDIVFYQIYQNGVLVDTISATSPLVFTICVNPNNLPNYQVVAINSANIASVPVSITIIPG